MHQSATVSFDQAVARYSAQDLIRLVRSRSDWLPAETLKMSGKTLALMPLPVSLTSPQPTLHRPPAVLEICPPEGVNLIAFEIKIREDLLQAETCRRLSSRHRI